MPPTEQPEAPFSATDLARVITRLNVGGPSHHVTILSTRMAGGLRGVLLAGATAEREGSMEEPARTAGARVVRVPGLVRDISPLRDVRALLWLYRYFRRNRPHIVATHMAKAGALGRLAAALAGVPIRVHTFHGHVLEGYFGGFKSRFYRRVEILLGRLTTHFVAISPEIANDLEAMGIGRGKTSIVPLGLDLEPFRQGTPGRLRAELGLATRTRLVGIVGRLVPIKNHALLLEAAGLLRTAHPDLRFLIVGDGELWDELRAKVTAMGLDTVVRFTGWRRDLPDVYADLDVVVCCSLNEGTPVSLIEAGAAARPVVGTDVGGTRHIVRDGENGLLVPSQDAVLLARALEHIISEAEIARRMGQAGRRLAFQNHSAERMVADLDTLYGSLLQNHRSARSEA